MSRISDSRTEALDQIPDLSEKIPISKSTYLGQEAFSELLINICESEEDEQQIPTIILPEKPDRGPETAAKSFPGEYGEPIFEETTMSSQRSSGGKSVKYVAGNKTNTRSFLTRVTRTWVCCWERLSKVLATLILFCVLVICIVQVAWHNLTGSGPSQDNGDRIFVYGPYHEELGIPQENVRVRHVRSLPDITEPPQFSVCTWQDLPTLDLKSVSTLHFQVSDPNRIMKEGHLTGYLSTEALRITGIPTFCQKPTEYVPDPLEFQKVGHLHLSGMGDCSFYSNLIISDWKYPQIQSLRLHGITITPELFSSLSNFIDRHNRSLHFLDLDECQLCPGPECEAGFLNLPEQFQLKITRLRKWTVDTSKKD